MPRLKRLYLQSNRLGAFDYGALAQMAELGLLRLDRQGGGDLGCGGEDLWSNDAAGITDAVALCGGGAQHMARNRASLVPFSKEDMR